jgi:hypothetical protein
MLLSLYGKLQNINPIKVDKTTIINLKREVNTHCRMKKQFWCHDD